MKSIRAYLVAAAVIIASPETITHADEPPLGDPPLVNEVPNNCGISISADQNWLSVNDNDDNHDEIWDFETEPGASGAEPVVGEKDTLKITVTGTADKSEATVTVSIDTGSDKIDGFWEGTLTISGQTLTSAQLEELALKELEGQKKGSSKKTTFTFPVLEGSSATQTLYIEGIKHSDSLKDVKINAKIEAPAGTTPDPDNRPFSACSLDATPLEITVYQVDLDVNGDGDLTDSCDGLATYMPGYESNRAVLHTGDSFKDVQYAGPQEMKLILTVGFGTDVVDSATFEILSSTKYPGFCGNGITNNDGTKVEQNENGEDKNDFSFFVDSDGNSNGETKIDGNIESGKAWAPIFCKDYGAWCEVEITLKKNGVAIGNPIKLTLPLDDNGDNLADYWQDLEINAWNEQFIPLPSRPVSKAGRDLVNPSLDDEESDSDGRNGDGGRNLPSMIWPNSTDSIEGDGLKVLEEYRGYILDGGPGIITAGQHKRLSTARKDLLVECSVEQGLTSSAKNGAGTNMTVVSGFTVANALGDVSSFYSNIDRGASIDLYWVEDDLVQTGQTITYGTNSFASREARVWSGFVEYYQCMGENTYQEVRAVGSGVPLADALLRKIDINLHTDIYNAGYGTKERLQEDNRNPNLELFVKVLLPTRIGILKGGLDDNGMIDPQFPRYLDKAEEPGMDIGNAEGYQQGAHVCVAAIADEGNYVYYDDLHRHFLIDEFERLVRRVIAHEIGHLIIQVLPGTSGDVLMDHYSPFVLSDGTVIGLSTCIWDDTEIKNTNLPNRWSAYEPGP